ncbi:MAG: YdeI/OmpD-associated family protein [Bacteroidia bacterium]
MLAKKLKLGENMTIVTMNAPADYKKSLGALPKGTKVTDKPAKANEFIHIFVKNKAELEKNIARAVKLSAPGGLIWISYPKGSSGIQTDLTRDKGWDCLKELNMDWLSLISFDGNWSAFAMRNTPPKGQSRASKDYHANQNAYADAKTKTVIVPEDLKAAFLKSKKAQSFFDALSFTGKKEYVMWIVGAKREETRFERVKKTIEKLLQGKKNPTEK